MKVEHANLLEKVEQFEFVILAANSFNGERIHVAIIGKTSNVELYDMMRDAGWIVQKTRPFGNNNTKVIFSQNNE